MADKGENKPFTSEQLDSMSFEDRLKYYNDAEVVDITNGLKHLIHDSDEFLQFISSEELMDQGRIPILGMKDGTIWMVGHSAAHGRYEHRSILTSLEKETGDVQFSTSLEGINSTPKEPFLEIKATKEEGYFKPNDVVKVQIGKGSDLSVRGIMYPGANKDLEKIFGDIPGLDIHLAYGMGQD